MPIGDLTIRQILFIIKSKKGMYWTFPGKRRTSQMSKATRFTVEEAQKYFPIWPPEYYVFFGLGVITNAPEKMEAPIFQNSIGGNY